MVDEPLPEPPAGAFAKQDASDDLAFVTHIDEGAAAALTARYRSVIPDGVRVLDLMSSWVSHLPPDRAYAEVVGHGIRAVGRQVAVGSFDAALCCVGAQYLQRPIAVFAEVRRVLTADAPFVVTFSNRCFPTKVVAIWRSIDAAGHAALVRLYLGRPGSPRCYRDPRGWSGGRSAGGRHRPGLIRRARRDATRSAARAHGLAPFTPPRRGAAASISAARSGRCSRSACARDSPDAPPPPPRSRRPERPR